MICIYMYILENVRYCIPTLHNISWCAVIISINYYSNSNIINKAYNIIQAQCLDDTPSLFIHIITFNRELKYCCFYFHWIKLRIFNVTNSKLFQQWEKYWCFNKVDSLQDKNIPSGFTLNFTSCPEGVELGGGGGWITSSTLQQKQN